MAKKKQTKSKAKNSEWLDEFKEAEQNEDLEAKFDHTTTKPKSSIDYSKRHDYHEGQIVSCQNQSKNYNATETATGTIAAVIGDTVAVLDAAGLIHWVKVRDLWIV